MTDAERDGNRAVIDELMAKFAAVEKERDDARLDIRGLLEWRERAEAQVGEIQGLNNALLERATKAEALLWEARDGFKKIEKMSHHLMAAGPLIEAMGLISVLLARIEEVVK